MTATKTKSTTSIEVLPTNPFIFEILNLASKQRSNSKKIEVLQKYDEPALKTILIWNFDESIISLLPEGEVPYASTGEQTSYSGTLTANGDVTGANLLTRNYLINSIQTNISAAGTTQNTATLLGNTINIVNTGISGAGVILPNVNPGIVIFIKNATGNDLSIYPQLNAQIDNASTNAAYVLASSNTTLRLISASYTQWYT